MNSLLSIPRALCLPAADIAALIQGRIIAAMPKMFIRPGQKFALYPVDSLAVPISIDKYYCSSFLPVAQNIDTNQKIQVYAQCESSQIINESQCLEKLSQLTIWTQEALDKILYHQQHIFISYLRVYKLSQPYELSSNVESNKLGKFIGLPNYLTASDTNPVLPDNVFSTRKLQLEKLESPAHSELEELLGVLSPLTVNNIAAKKLEEDIQTFLGWNTQQVNQTTNPNLDWINEIAALGNRTKEENKQKTNYHAGTDFEIIVRKSLEFLGFTIDYFHKGGAGGVDIFCSHPYPLVGECKSGKRIPNNTAV